MSTEKEQVKLQKGKAFFTLVGKAKVSDYTYKLHELSTKTGYKYSRLNLGVETRAGNVVYCEAMGGFSTVKDNTIFVSSKEDIKNTYEIDWEDRFDDTVLASINESKFIKIGLEEYEKDGKKKTFTKRFLSWYDAIDYVNEHLTNDMVVNVSGVLKYSFYQDKIQMKKEIQSIYLSRAEEKDFKATFVQSILLDKSSVSKLDKDTNEYAITARVIDYVKEWNKKEVKTNIPYLVNYIMKNDNPDVTKKFLEKFFKVKKGINELAVEGNIIEGTQVGEITEDDIPDDMKELIDLGLYTKEEILGKIVVKGDRVSKLVITKPYIQQKEKEDGTKSLQYFFIENRYSEDDLILDFMIENEEAPVDTEGATEADSSDDWMKELK